MKWMLPLLLFLFLSSFAYGQNYQEAQKFARQNDRRMFVVMTAVWCGPCQDLKNRILHSFQKQLANNFVVYYLDIDQEKDIYNGAVPTIHVLSKGGKVILNTHVGSFVNHREFAEWLLFTKWDTNNQVENEKMKDILR